MTAATAARNTNLKYGGPFQMGYPMAVDVIYKGTMVAIDSGGEAAPAADTAGFGKVIGIAVETVDNSAGSARDKKCLVHFPVVAEMTCTNATEALTGSYFYVVDDQTLGVAGDTTNEIAGGILISYTSATTGLFYFPGPSGGELSVGGARKTARSEVFNLDNGAAATIDSVIMVPTAAMTISEVRVVYDIETAGTVAAGTVKVGTTVGGAEIVAAVAYTNASTVGSKTALTIVSGAVAANTMVVVRHTGVAATAAGHAYIEIDYSYDA